MDRGAIAQELFALLSDLVAIRSTTPPGHTARIAAHCEHFLLAHGYEVQRRYRSHSVENVVARLGGGKPSIVFNAHADTADVGERAAWQTDPFNATVIDGLVYGLGACDSKGAIAVQLWLAREMARRGGPRRGELVFTFVGDKENLGRDGLAFLREVGALRPDTLVVAAQTRNRLVIEQRDGPGAQAFAEAIRSVTGKAPQPVTAVGASDARYFAGDGIELLVTGPGDAADSHMPNEFVRLEEMVEAALIHIDAASRLLR